MIPPVVQEMIGAAQRSVEAIRGRVSNVRYDRIELGDDAEFILFDFDGKPMRGKLAGRNRDLLIGFNDDADKAIAVRVMLDGHAVPIETDTGAGVGFYGVDLERTLHHIIAVVGYYYPNGRQGTRQEVYRQAVEDSDYQKVAERVGERGGTDDQKDYALFLAFKPENA